MARLLALAIALIAGAGVITRAEARLDPMALTREIDQFVLREVTTHFASILTLDPPPDRVLGAKTTGEFSWGTFMRALAATTAHAGTESFAGRDVPQWIGRMGLIESRAGSKAFSQMYAALALQHYGENLDKNAIWQRLTASERDEWRGLLDVRRFYDPVNRRVINLAENYHGVAARVAAIDYRLGLSPDRGPLDALIDRAFEPFANGRLFSDDAPPTGRFDRYSNEYARYVWDAAAQADRTDVLEKLRPSIKAQMNVWWDLVDGDDGYGYCWGRSLGIVSYLDTLEIVAFLGRYPEFRPAPLGDLVAQYARAWQYLRHDYKDDKHLLSLFDFGRGNYSYINLDREWQQTTGFFGKAAVANATLAAAVSAEKLTGYPERPALANLMRFQYFRSSDDRKAGVWLVRQGPIQFALPITTGTRPGVADYLPAPHGFRGFAAPVEQNVPALVPYLVLGDGRTIVAADGADDIQPSADGHELRAVWHRWAEVGKKSGQLIDPGLTTEVRWVFADGVLKRFETLSASAERVVSVWRVSVPTTFSDSVGFSKRERDGVGSSESVTLGSDRDQLTVTVETPWPLHADVHATGDTPAGRGAKGYIPIHLMYEAHDIHLKPGEPLTWQITLQPRATEKQR